MGGYDETYRRWQRDPDAFWLGLASAVEWEHEPEAALDASGAPLYRWFPDGRLNMCFNLLDRHVRDGRGEQAALIYDSPVTGQVRTYTYRELLDETARVAERSRAWAWAAAIGSSSTCRWFLRRSWP